MVESMEALVSAFNECCGVTMSELGEALRVVSQRLSKFNQKEESYIGSDTVKQNGFNKFLDQNVESEVSPERGRRAQIGISDELMNPFIDNSEFEEILKKYCDMESETNVYFSNN